jgi:hypothetical protein
MSFMCQSAMATEAAISAIRTMSMPFGLRWVSSLVTP